LTCLKGSLSDRRARSAERYTAEQMETALRGAFGVDSQLITDGTYFVVEGDEGWFYGKPWEHPDDASRQSAVAHITHATTPFLLLQGEADSIDPLGQSLEMYRALRQAGVQVDMVQYPRENHAPLRIGMYGFPSTEPWHGFDARQRLVKFFSSSFERR
jgi:dipeptidyl aminopeptidase/acylaminoacyl peptidase